MKLRSQNSVPVQNRPIIDDVVLAFDKRVVPPARSVEGPAGTLHLPKLTLVKSEREGR